ncbi:hypothetical protein GN956_G25003 [Arapaima gigas]
MENFLELRPSSSPPDGVSSSGLKGVTALGSSPLRLADDTARKQGMAWKIGSTHNHSMSHPGFSNCLRDVLQSIKYDYD